MSDGVNREFVRVTVGRRENVKRGNGCNNTER